MARTSGALASAGRRKTGAEPRAVVIHSLAEAKAALAAAAAKDVQVELWSAPGASAYAGAGWFKAVLEAAGQAVPAARFSAVLDCADLAGHALGAFRIGIRAVCFTGTAAVAAKLADIAGREGRRLLRRRPRRMLDLRHMADPLAACRAWLGEVRRAKRAPVPRR
ncbi:MAG: hypothetical protein ACHQF3_12430 [Alphaproteobacteria bacterium]